MRDDGGYDLGCVFIVVVLGAIIAMLLRACA